MTKETYSNFTKWNISRRGNVEGRNTLLQCTTDSDNTFDLAVWLYFQNVEAYKHLCISYIVKWCWNEYFVDNLDSLSEAVDKSADRIREVTYISAANKFRLTEEVANWAIQLKKHCPDKVYDLNLDGMNNAAHTICSYVQSEFITAELTSENCLEFIVYNKGFDWSQVIFNTITDFMHTSLNFSSITVKAAPTMGIGEFTAGYQVPVSNFVEDEQLNRVYIAQLCDGDV